jgi:hypothetical protein
MKQKQERQIHNKKRKKGEHKMKKVILGWCAVGMMLFGFVSTSEAALIQSEPILTNPASTKNMWGYSYKQDSSLPQGPGFYVTSTAQFADAAFQGYVTGNSSAYTCDFFSSGGANDFMTVHVMETYIKSSSNQSINLQFVGDDGNALFVNGVFVGGVGFSATARPTLNLAANTAYHLQYVGNNYSGPWAFAIGLNNGGTNPFASIDSVAGITMNANASQLAPTPIPAAAWLFGSGLMGLAGVRRKKRQ